MTSSIHACEVGTAAVGTAQWGCGAVSLPWAWVPCRRILLAPESALWGEAYSGCPVGPETHPRWMPGTTGQVQRP